MKSCRNYHLKLYLWQFTFFLISVSSNTRLFQFLIICNWRTNCSEYLKDQEKVLCKIVSSKLCTKYRKQSKVYQSPFLVFEWILSRLFLLSFSNAHPRSTNLHLLFTSKLLHKCLLLSKRNKCFGFLFPLASLCKFKFIF